MTKDRIIQIIALIVCIGGVAATGNLVPQLLEKSEAHALRYTDVSVEGAPPFVALGTMIGAVRGLIVDYLWIKVHIRKQQGKFYEVMHDAELITRLQPRFSAVWAFHGHNMAYNISVATNTQEERWEWVNAGIRLVRNRGLRYNPNDLQLHRELAFWFAHKIEGYADDAHLFYKRMFSREWHYVLGQPPEDYDERIAWIKAVADAPDTLAEAEQRTPGVRALVQRIADELGNFARLDNFSIDSQFLRFWGEWKSATEQSVVAEMLGFAQEWRETRPVFRAFDEIASDPDPQVQQAWETLLLHARKRVLLDEYNMEPQLMYEFTRDLGPIDWRHGQAHALFFSRRGMLRGESRVLNEGDIYKVVNNDRVQLQAMQGLARWGRITFDPFSIEPPSRFPDQRWIDTIDEYVEKMYVKHYETRGAGGETFLGFLKNFMSSSVRELYRSGEWDKAQQILDRLDQLFGSGQVDGPIGPNPRFRMPLDVFVREEILDEYSYQPHLAPSEVVAALRRGIRVGVGQNRPQVYEQSLQFAQQVTEYFRTNEYFDFETQFGTGRMRDILGQLEDSLEVAFLQLMADPGLALEERLSIWRQMGQFQPQDLRHRVYDRLKPVLERQFQRNPLSQRYAFNELFTEPPGMEQYRIYRAEQQRQEREEEDRSRERDPIERR